MQDVSDKVIASKILTIVTNKFFFMVNPVYANHELSSHKYFNLSDGSMIAVIVLKIFMADDPNKKKKDSKQVSQQEWEKNYKRKRKGTVTKSRKSKSR